MSTSLKTKAAFHSHDTTPLDKTCRARCRGHVRRCAMNYFKTLFEMFQETFHVISKWLKSFQNMIKVYAFSMRYEKLFMRNHCRNLRLTGLLTLLQWTIQPALIVIVKLKKNISYNISRYFIFISTFHEIFQAKIFMKFHSTSHVPIHGMAVT